MSKSHILLSATCQHNFYKTLKTKIYFLRSVRIRLKEAYPFEQRHRGGATFKNKTRVFARARQKREKKRRERERKHTGETVTFHYAFEDIRHPSFSGQHFSRVDYPLFFHYSRESFKVVSRLRMKGMNKKRKVKPMCYMCMYLCACFLFSFCILYFYISAFRRSLILVHFWFRTSSCCCFCFYFYLRFTVTRIRICYYSKILLI